jgi:hypothetical protein
MQYFFLFCFEDLKIEIKRKIMVLNEGKVEEVCGFFKRKNKNGSNHGLLITSMNI